MWLGTFQLWVQEVLALAPWEVELSSELGWPVGGCGPEIELTSG